MAARRSRIKGIANIPQRRKVAAASAEPPIAAVDDAKCENNLNPSPAQVISETECGGRSTCSPSAQVVQSSDEQVEQIQRELSNTVLERDKDEEKNDTIAEDNVDNTLNAPLIKAASPAPPAFSRRRLIKPAISLKAIQKSSPPPSILPTTEQLQPTQLKVADNTPATPNVSDHVYVRKLPPVKDECINKEISLLGIIKMPLGQNMDNNCMDKDKIDEVVTRPSPACSPSKYMNRARIKAVPRLGQRRPSFSIGSASESEDESKKSYKTHRIRNDSVCSSVSTAAPPEPSAPTSETSNVRKKEFNTIIQRKCRRTDQSRKLAEARRDFQQKFSDGKPDRQKLTMIDLIFYNPSSSPMSQKRKRKDTETDSVLSTRNEEIVDDAPAVKDAEAEGSDEENTVPAPQITIGADGEIIVDEKSLLIENKEVARDRERLKKSDLVDGDTFDTNYGVFKRVKRSKDWSKEETLRFYKALNTMGTDFTLMCTLFPERNRRELKMKFKKEERINRALVDRAVMQPIEFDITELQQDLERQALEEMRVEQLKQDKLQHKEEVRLAKEKEREAKEKAKVTEACTDMDGNEAVAVPKGRKERKRMRIIRQSDVTPAPSAKEALKNKLKRGINSLVDSDDNNDETAVKEQRKKSEVNENNNHIIQGEVFEVITDMPVDSQSVIADSATFSDSTNKDNEIVKEETTNDVEEQAEAALAEGSIVVSSSTDESGTEVYSIYTINEQGDKVPLELSPGILELLLKNQLIGETSTPAEATVEATQNLDDSPSDTIMDNVMADISLSNIHDQMNLNLSTADCMILSFEDIDANIPENTATDIVALQTTP